MTETEGSSELLRCSFCGKSQTQVDKLIAGPGVYICNECIALCTEIIKDGAVVQTGSTVTSSTGLSSPTTTLRALQQELERVAKRLATEIELVERRDL